MNLRRLAFAALPPLLAVVIGGWGSRNAPEVYPRLDKPDWAPPAGVFGPVWTGLYLMIGLAGWRIAEHGSAPTRALHLTQMGLNAAWPVLFFGIGAKPASVATIAALDAALLAEVARLRREDPASAALLAPYLAWSGFATALNLATTAP